MSLTHRLSVVCFWKALEQTRSDLTRPANTANTAKTANTASADNTANTAKKANASNIYDFDESSGMAL